MAEARSVDLQVQRVESGTWFKPEKKTLNKIIPKAKTKSTTHPIVMKPEKELFLFTFPKDVILSPQPYSLFFFK